MGRYRRCSNMASLIGRMLDSTDRVMKNHQTAKVMIGRRRYCRVPSTASVVRNRNAAGVASSKNPFLNG